MANNPRKFSEKIALLNQKQQECNVEFEKILQEVSGAIKGANPQTRLQLSHSELSNQLNNGAEQINQQGQPTASNHISIHQLITQSQQQQQQQQLIQSQQAPGFFGENGQRNLLLNQQANVNNLTDCQKSKSSIDLRSALSNLNDLTQGELKKSNSRNRMPSPNSHHSKTSPSIGRQPMLQQDQQRHPQLQQQYQQYNGSYNEFNLTTVNSIPIQSTRSQVNLSHYASQNANDQQLVHKSTYHSSSHNNRSNPYYLSIPESNWRRTNSDSALHQSTSVYCDQQQQQQVQLNPQMYQQQANQVQSQHQMYDLQRQQQQQQQQMPAQDLNKCDNQQHLRNDVPGNNGAQGTILYSSNKTDLSGAGTPVISINYQQQANAFPPAMGGNSQANVQSNMYSGGGGGQSVACTQTNYVNTNTMNQAPGNENSYSVQQMNGKNSNGNALNNSAAGSQFNQQRNLINPNAQATNRNQLPTLAFQSSSQSNLNQLNDQTATFGNSLNSNHIDHPPNHHHHSSAIHVNTTSAHHSNNNFLYANNNFSANQTTGSLPDLSQFQNHQTGPLCVPLDQDDALSSGLNSNDNSNNSNQSALSSSSFQFSGVTSSSVPCGSMNNYRANQSNFMQYNCSNPNSSNSNSPLHQNAPFSNLTAPGQQQAMANSQPMNVPGAHNNSNFNNKLQDNSKFINQQITNNQLATQFHNHHISSPVRPSSVESTDDSGVIFSQLTGNDILINDLENDENIAQFDFDLFSGSQDNPSDKLTITNDQVLDKLDCDQDPNNNDTNSAAFYPETTNQLMNHRNVSTTPSENASTPNSPASSIHNLNSPVSSPTAAHNAATNATSIQINSNLANSVSHNMNLSNDNHPSPNSAMLPNKTDFNLINESHMIANQMNTAEGSAKENHRTGASIADADEYLQLQGTFSLDELPSNENNENIFNENGLNSKDQDISMTNYDLMSDGQSTPAGIPNIIFTEHDFTSDELYPQMST